MKDDDRIDRAISSSLPYYRRQLRNARPSSLTELLRAVGERHGGARPPRELNAIGCDGDLPTANVEVQGQEVRALLDTGTTLSVVLHSWAMAADFPCSH